jgi:hypothetical protein
MKKSELQQLIKEEINNIMNEDEEKTYIFSYIDAWGGREENEEFWSVEVKASSEEEAKEKALEKARNSPDTRGFVGRFTLDPNTKWPRSEEPEQ